MKKLQQFAIVTLVMLSTLNIITLNILSKTQADLTKLQKRTLEVSNRLALVEGHIPSLDLNDERMYEYVRKLNINDEVLAQRMEWLESILITIECVDY